MNYTNLTREELPDHWLEIYKICYERSDQYFDLEEKDYQLLKRNEDGKVIAIIQAEINGNNLDFDYPHKDKPIINSLFVMENYRRQGIGKELVNQMAEDLSADIIVADIIESVEKDGDVREFYEKVKPEVVNLREFKQKNR